MNVSVFVCVYVFVMFHLLSLLTSTECSLSTSRTVAEGVQEKKDTCVWKMQRHVALRSSSQVPLCLCGGEHLLLQSLHCMVSTPTQALCCVSIPLLSHFSVSLQLSLLNKGKISKERTTIKVLNSFYCIHSHFLLPNMVPFMLRFNILSNIGKKYPVGALNQFKITVCFSSSVSPSPLLLGHYMYFYMFSLLIWSFTASFVLSKFNLPPSLFPCFVLFFFNLV